MIVPSHALAVRRGGWKLRNNGPGSREEERRKGRSKRASFRSAKSTPSFFQRGGTTRRLPEEREKRQGAAIRLLSLFGPG